MFEISYLAILAIIPFLVAISLLIYMFVKRHEMKKKSRLLRLNEYGIKEPNTIENVNNNNVGGNNMATNTGNAMMPDNANSHV